MWVGRRGHLLLPTAIAAACVLLVPMARAQSQDQSQQSSVADAARRAKQKKAASKGSKVIDDDNLGSNLKSGGPDVTNVGASAAASANPEPPANGQASANAEAATAEQAAAKNGDQASAKENDPAAKADDSGAATGDDPRDAEIAEVKAQVAETEKQLDLLKREFALDSEAYYSKTDYSTDKAGKAKLDEERQRISAKQQELDEVKARLAALLDQQSRRKGK